MFNEGLAAASNTAVQSFHIRRKYFLIFRRFSVSKLPSLTLRSSLQCTVKEFKEHIASEVVSNVDDYYITYYNIKYNFSLTGCIGHGYFIRRKRTVSLCTVICGLACATVS